MKKKKLIRITTVPASLDILLEGQIEYMQNYFEVCAISSDNNTLTALGKSKGYTTHHVEMTRKITPLSDLKAVYKLYKFFNKEKPFIVHTHTPKAGIVGMMAAWMANVPHRLHTVAGLPLMEATGPKRVLLNLIEKLTYSYATKVYPNSKGLFDFIISENLAKPTKLKIIGEGSSNGIDTQYFDPTPFVSMRNSLRQELAISQDDFVYVFVGRLVGDKGINELISAFQNLNSRPTSNLSKLVLVGPFETELDPLKAETLLAIQANPNIVSVGFQRDVRPYFAIADALVFPSYREGFPNVVMQAGAMGLPSIVSDINGCNEIIIPDVNGILIPSKSTKALEEAMRTILEDTNLYRELKNNARVQITSRFQRQQIWEALLLEYKSFLRKN
ncbi:glycosyltransferase family 4 protein [Aequorivita sp. Q41]|uniref:glycosyltransferase family 4 protein n=1 Tax=Aequorivita sp. Q41 TaxID=3153300 RepID=UPI003242C5A2